MNEAALRSELLAWFDRFSRCVREQDIAGARAMFDERVVAFGTRNERLDGIDALVDQQWQPTWRATRDFRFLTETMVLDVSESGDRAWASSLWESCGDPGGVPAFERRGRATFVFARTDTWRCVHSHLSIMPNGTL